MMNMLTILMNHKGLHIAICPEKQKAPACVHLQIHDVRPNAFDSDVDEWIVLVAQFPLPLQTHPTEHKVPGHEFSFFFFFVLRQMTHIAL